MDPAAISQQLLDLLAEHGVHIRKDSMGGGGGGLCRLNDRDLLLIDRDSSSWETAVVCARAAKSVIIDLESIYLKPAVRDFIDKYSGDV